MKLRCAAVVLIALAFGACGGGHNDIAQARQLVTDLRAGRIDAVRSNFDDVMDASLSADQIAGLVRGFTTTHGNFVSTGAPTSVMRHRITVVDVPVTMAKGPALIRVSFDSDGKIAGLFFLNAGAPLP